MPDFFGKWMRAREIAHTKRDDNRVVRPFAWGLEFITDHVNGDDPRNVLREYSARAMAGSEEFYALPEITDWDLKGDHLTWTSVVKTPSIENNTVHARLFTPKRERKNKPRAARSEERREGKSVDLGGRRIIKKKRRRE